MGWRAGSAGVLVVVAGLAACAGSRGADPAGVSYLTLRAPGMTHQLRLAADGAVMSANFQLQPTGDGYHGTAGAGTVSLHSQGERIVGVVGDRPVDLHVSSDGQALRAVGTFAGRMGRLTAAPGALVSWLGPCRYDLEPTGARFEGTRICARRALPGDRASVELPPAFLELTAHRRAMLLALLLSTSPS